MLSQRDEHFIHTFHSGGLFHPQRIQPVSSVIQARHALGSVQLCRDAQQLTIAGRIIDGCLAKGFHCITQILAGVSLISVCQVTQITAIHELIEITALQHEDVGNLTGANLQGKPLLKLIIGNHPQEVQLDIQHILRKFRQCVRLRCRAFFYRGVCIPAHYNIKGNSLFKRSHPVVLCGLCR